MLVAYQNLSMSTTDPKGRGTIAPGLYEIKADFRESKAVSNPHFERPGNGDFWTPVGDSDESQTGVTDLLGWE